MSGQDREPIPYWKMRSGDKKGTPQRDPKGQGGRTKCFWPERERIESCLVFQVPQNRPLCISMSQEDESQVTIKTIYKKKMPSKNKRSLQGEDEIQVTTEAIYNEDRSFS